MHVAFQITNGYNIDAKEDTESGTPEASDVQSQTAPPPPEKKPKCRAYRSEWSDKFPWLRCEVVDGNEKMFCSRCEKAGRRNGFTRGSNNLRMSALIEHSQSNDHVAAHNLTPQRGVLAAESDQDEAAKSPCGEQGYAAYAHCKLWRDTGKF